MPSVPTFEPYVLTPFDHSMAPVHISSFLTFHCDDPSRAVSVLGAGLIRLVELLPFLTGNVTSSSRVKGKVNVLEVQPPTESFLHNHPILKVKNHTQYADHMNGSPAVNRDLLSHEDFIPLSFDMGVDDLSPVFRIQVNVMLDGVIVCFAFHHMALDGGGIMNVMKELSVCCRDPSASPNFLQTSSQQEEKTRHAIFQAAFAPDISNRLHADYGSYDWIPPTDSTSDDLVSRNLILDATKIKTLHRACVKALHNRSIDSKVPLSTNTIASAVIWLCLIRARYGHPVMQAERASMPKESCILIAVNVRSRLEQILSASYMGNALVTIESYVPIQPIISSLNQSDYHFQNFEFVNPRDIYHLADVALSLHNTLQSVTEDYVRGVISHIAKKDDWAASPRPGDFVLSSLRKYKVYEFDFGPCLGSVKDFDVLEARFAGLSWLKPARGESGIAPWEVRIALEPMIMKRMQKDVLLRWLTPISRARL